MVEELGERAESVRNRAVDPSIDNMLKITNDGRKLALDQRMINLCSPMMKHQRFLCVPTGCLIYREETTDIHGTQLVFCDLSTPKNDGSHSRYITAYGISCLKKAYPKMK